MLIKVKQLTWEKSISSFIYAGMTFDFIIIIQESDNSTILDIW